MDDRYADGWAYNPSTCRWIKVACQQKKNAMEALPALLVSRAARLNLKCPQRLDSRCPSVQQEKTRIRETTYVVYTLVRGNE